ncbi:TPA: chromate transporter, partial [Klebsiella michiganensis]|nr:chromate transporter [Klebsiella michiganensis]HDS8620782.1 chromate transporter [Klebsiella michiganensis]
ALNFCMVLPGPEAQQLATYIGWLMHRTLGGVIAGLLFILPSLFILIALSWIYIAWGDVAIIAGIFYGIKPAVAAIVLQAAHRIGSRALKHGAHWAIAAAAFVAVFALNVPFPVIVISAAITGFIGGRIAPEKFHSGSGHNKQEKAAVDAAVIDDHTPVPAHALFSWAKLLRIVAAGALLWLIPMTVLTLGLGWAHPVTQMGWFFTKAALLTFGGAYAVLPYVYQG